MRLHLGCGRTRRDGWTNVDHIEISGVTDLVCDLDGPELAKVVDADTVSHSEGVHVLEHLTRPLEFMEALWTVTEPGGTARFRTPYGSSDDAWEDPTHVRPYFVHSFGYFGQPFYWRADYGYRGDWRVVSLQLAVERARWDDRRDDLAAALMTERNVVHEMVVDLEAVKPARPPDRDLIEPPPVSFVML